MLLLNWSDGRLFCKGSIVDRREEDRTGFLKVNDEEERLIGTMLCSSTQAVEVEAVWVEKARCCSIEGDKTETQLSLRCIRPFGTRWSAQNNTASRLEAHFESSRIASNVCKDREKLVRHLVDRFLGGGER